MGGISFNFDDALVLSERTIIGEGFRLVDNSILSDFSEFSTLQPGREALDAINLTDNVLARIRYLLPVSDALTLSDSIERSSVSILSDSISISDAVSVLLSSSFVSLTVSASDQIGLSDSLFFFQKPNKISAGDSLVLEDSIRVNLRSTDLVYLRRYLNDF